MLDILKLALPIALTSLAGILAVLLNTKFMGDASNYNLYILTLFMPFNFWVISLFESFKVPATSVATYAYHRGKLELIGSQIGCLLFMTFLGLLLPVAALVFFPKSVMFLLSINNLDDFNQFKLFSYYMFAASYFLAVFIILSAILNGISRHIFAMVITMSGVLLGVTVNYYLIKYTELAMLSMPIASLITYSILLLSVVIILFRDKVLSFKYLNTFLSKENFKIVKQLALPVWATYLLITLAVLFFTSFLSPFGHAVVAGFGIAYRIQTLIILPAISVGVAMGILLNKNMHNSHNKLICTNGIILCAGIYSVLAFVIYWKANLLVSFISADPECILAASHYLKIVAPSYIGLSISLCFCMALDQIGYGIQSAIFTGGIFVMEIMMSLILLRYVHSADALYWSIAIGNIAGGVLSVFFVMFSPKIYLKIRIG